MQGEKLRQIKEATKGINLLKQALNNCYPEGRVVGDEGGRIIFIKNGLKYRIAYSKEGILKNFIEYKNYMKIAYEIRTELEKVCCFPERFENVTKRRETMTKKYLEKLRIIVNDGKEETVREITEEIDLKNVKDVLIIATKILSDCKINYVRENALNYYFLKKAISEIEKYSLIGNITEKSINMYNNACFFNEFLNLHSEGIDLEKLKKGSLQVENNNYNRWKFDLEDFLSNGTKPQWSSKYREYKLDGKTIEVNRIPEYQESRAFLENKFNDNYKLEEIQPEYTTNATNYSYDEQEENVEYLYKNESEPNEAQFNIDWDSVVLDYILYT
ncbi:MAG: hypothetical protein ACRCZ9_10320 [Fusobacteriaceae bacterium]